jgi:hypothetical protein
MMTITDRIFPGIFTALWLLMLPGAVAGVPKIIAYNGAGGDAPEGTLLAAGSALRRGADGLWLTLQASSDGEIVVYRPDDLMTLTNLQGPVGSLTAAELKEADAAWRFNRAEGYPLRGKGTGIPTLEEMLTAYPTVTFYLEVRSPGEDVRRFGRELHRVLSKTRSLKRCRVYADNPRVLDTLPVTVQRFESRARTLAVASGIALSGRCLLNRKSGQPRWYMSPLRQRVKVSAGAEEAGAEVQTWLLWRRNAVKCLEASGPAMLVLTGIRNAQELAMAERLQAEAVTVTSLGWLKGAAEKPVVVTADRPVLLPYLQ